MASESVTPFETPSDTTSSRTIRCRDRLLRSGFYLAADDILKKVEWVRQGRSHYLAATMENSDSNTCTTQRQLAQLSAIVVIDSNNFWLTFDGGYRKGNGIWQHLYEVKLSCTVCEPPMDPLKNDFATVMKNLRVLMQKVGTPGYEKGKGFLFYDNRSPTPTRFKIRHSPFQRITDNKTNHNILDLSTLRNGEDFLPENIDLTHQESREELFLLQKTHHTIPLEARGDDGYILSPAEYKSHLKNAVVELQFNLWHWPIAPKNGSTGKDSFTADIVQIRVLVPPPPEITSTPQKRKIAAYLDPEETASPSKKREM